MFQIAKSRTCYDSKHIARWFSIKKNHFMQFRSVANNIDWLESAQERSAQTWRRSVEVDITNVELWQLYTWQKTGDEYYIRLRSLGAHQKVACATSPVGSEDAKSTAVWSTSLLMWYAAEVIVGSRAPASTSSPEQFPTSPSHDVPRQTRRHVLPFDWQPTVASLSVRLIQNVVGSLRSAQPVTINVM